MCAGGCQGQNNGRNNGVVYEFHELANLFPLIEGQEFAALVEDVRANGLREPVILHEGKILDGRNRYRAAKAAGVEVRVKEFDGSDPLAFVISLNLHRRHLSESARGLVAANIETLKQGRPGKDANLHDSVPRSQAAEMLNVSERQVATGAKVRDNAAPELQQAVMSGKASLSAAADVAELPKAEQAEIVAKGEREILEAAKRIRQEKAEVRREENAAKLAAAPPPPDGKYRVIVIDPPWQMEKIERDARPNQVAFDYPTMTPEQLRAFPVSHWADDDCHMFCWTTHKHLPLAIQLMDFWGFRYVLTMVWHKPGGFQPVGLPQYNCEFVVYARRGAPQFIDTKAFNCCFQAPRREHSRKPDEFYDVIRRVTAGPRIDVFSREERDGFDTWGNESGKFAA